MCKVHVFSSYSCQLLVIVEVPAYFSAIHPYGSGLWGPSARGLFHEAASPVTTRENTSQNGNNDLSLFHKMTSDKRTVARKLQQSDRQI
jgi:hypothetical protein